MSNATDTLALYEQAERDVLKGQSVRWGERWLTRADLSEIRKGRMQWQRAVDRELRAGSHAAGAALADFSGVS